LLSTRFWLLMDLTDQERRDIVVALARTADEYRKENSFYPGRADLVQAAERMSMLILKIGELQWASSL
jgi:hypothetical protein